MAEPATEVMEPTPLVIEERTEPAPPVTVLPTPERTEVASPTTLVATETREERSWVAPKPAAATRRTGVETFMFGAKRSL